MKQRKQPARYKLTLGKGLYCGDDVRNFGVSLWDIGHCPMKKNKEPKKSNYPGNWIGSSTALGALVFVLTSEPVWIAVGVAIGVALDWKRPKNKE